MLCLFAGLAFVGLRLLTVLYTDLLWFGELGYRDAFLTMTLTKSKSLLVFGSCFAFFIGINIYFARFYGRITRAMAFEVVVDGEEEIPPDRARRQKSIWIGVCAVLSFFMGIAGTPIWTTALKYFNAVPFDLRDPIFNNDVSFYVFTLPMYTFIQGWAIAGVFVAAIAVASSYYQDRSIRHDDQNWITTPHVRAHVSVLGACLALLLAWGYWLKEYELLYSFRKEAFFGAGYTDLHIQNLSYHFMLVLLVVIAGLLIYNTRIKTWRIPALCAALYASCLLVCSWGIPIAYEALSVRPNEFEREAPYIRHAIDFTRKAYALDKIEEVPFPGESDLAMSDIYANRTTVQSIPLWDRRPLLEAYGQLQEIRSYYKFHSIDVDRYHIQGQYRQIMLSAREFSRDWRPQQGDTWVNRHLVYTHGYGLVMNSATDIAAEGLPEFLIQDIPPASSHGLAVTRPEIYYGETMRDYAIVRTSTPEFDYPRGDENVYTTYQGRGGVPLHGFFRRLAFALRFADPYLFFTGALTPESRIMFDRHIGRQFGEDTPRRFAKIAPFLRYDTDPYLALIEGRLVWIQDAYTTSNMFPYAQPHGRPYVREMNYIRNSVKAVMDAYDGTITFYAWDTEDPILRTYMNIFPDMFKSAEKIPPALRSHLRYPLDLFDIQVSLYNMYHMTSPLVFYNREDVWETPTEFYGMMDRPIRMTPYYVMARLPDSNHEEYILMLPASPSGKPNMIGWIFARCDAPNYGKLIVYKLPKEKLIYGPMLIERRINQDTDVSREITLWDQRGSDVIRGSLLVIPIENSFIYVEPLYLRATQSGMPELKRVLVIHGDRLAMGINLDDALLKVFSERLERPSLNAGAPVPSSYIETYVTLAKRARTQFETAQRQLRNGEFAAYGESIEALRQTLEQMNQSNDP